MRVMEITPGYAVVELSAAECKIIQFALSEAHGTPEDEALAIGVGALDAAFALTYAAVIAAVNAIPSEKDPWTIGLKAAGIPVH